MQPGHIYFVDLPEIGYRPIIVVSREELNRGNGVLAVPCTSQKYESRSRRPNSVAFRAGDFGLTRDCVAQCEAILSVTKEHCDDESYVGEVDDETMRNLIRAIGYVIAAECEPV